MTSILSKSKHGKVWSLWLLQGLVTWLGHRSPGQLLCKGLADRGLSPQAPVPPELNLQLTLQLHTELQALNVFFDIFDMHLMFNLSAQHL